mmetsp:Transcript_70399/g.126895  ORF Transcript_70399/g.126895 Transcript_70399/m.126895 type:complete len:158 (+) Transcript_70399:254-727(+)
MVGRQTRRHGAVTTTWGAASLRQYRILQRAPQNDLHWTSLPVNLLIALRVIAIGSMVGRPAKRIGVVSTTSVAVLPPPQVNPMIAMLATRIGRRACLTGNSNGAAGTTIAAVQLQWGVKRTIAKGMTTTGQVTRRSGAATPTWWDARLPELPLTEVS